jgi:peptidoglycan/LPS O-acetylase OafA/YrhL
MNRILGLDIVRAIAILLVLWAHSTYVFSPEVSEFLQSLVPSYAGVSIFFVLSGYLIGGILLRSAESEFHLRDLGQFWIRRWFRTLPNYFLILIFLITYDAIIFGSAVSLSLPHFFFTQNFTRPNPDFFPEAWSLSVEEWFYLLFPAFCYLGFKIISDRKKIILALACFFIIAPFLLRLMMYLSVSSKDFLPIQHTVVFRLDGLMYGIVAAYVQRYHGTFWNKMRYPGLWLASVLLIFMFVSNHFFIESAMYLVVFYYCFQSLMTLAVLPYFSSLREIRNKKVATIIVFISTISYAMYLVNLSVVQWRLVPAFMSVSNLNELTGEYSVIVRFALFWILTIVGSYLLYRYFEKPMMDLRDKVIIDGRDEEKRLEVQQKGAN